MCNRTHNWKVGKVIPLLKPGRYPEHLKSYMLIVLLLPVAKIKERLLLSEFDLNIPLAENQRSFRKSRSTITAHHCISDKIKRGINKASVLNVTPK